MASRGAAGGLTDLREQGLRAGGVLRLARSECFSAFGIVCGRLSCACPIRKGGRDVTDAGASPTPEAGPLRGRTHVPAPWAAGGSETVFLGHTFFEPGLLCGVLQLTAIQSRGTGSCSVSHGPPPPAKLAGRAPRPRLLETPRPLRLVAEPTAQCRSQVGGVVPGAMQWRPALWRRGVVDSGKVMSVEKQDFTVMVLMLIQASVVANAVSSMHRVPL